MFQAHQLPSDPLFLEQVRAMLKQESTTYRVSRDYFRHARGAGTSGTEVEVSPSTRAMVLSWGYQIADCCKLERKVAIYAIGYFDQFLSNSRSRSAKAVLSNEYDFQLCFIACMFIALKNYSGVTVELEFVSEIICKGMYDVHELSEMEMQVLIGLGWRLNGPSAMDFAHAFMQMLPPQEKTALDVMTRAAQALVEAAVMDYSLTLQNSPSSIAYASILIVSDCLDFSYSDPLDKAKWIQSIALITGLTEDKFRIQAIREKMMKTSPFSDSDSSEEVSATGVDDTNY